MSDNQPEQKGFFEKLTETTTVLFAGTGVVQLVVTPFTRNGFGTLAFAWNGPFCLLFLLLWASLANQPEVMLYIPFWLVMLLWRRITPDREVVSFYQGWPWLGMRVPFVRREGVGKAVEGLLVGGLGLFLQQEQIRFGYLLIAAGWSIIIHENIEREAIRSRIRKMKDAEKIQRWLMDEYRR